MGWGFFFGIWLWCFFFDLIVLIPFSGMSAVFLYGLRFSRWTWPKGAKKDQVPKFELFLCANFSHLKVTYKGQYRKLYLYWKGTQFPKFRIFWRYTQVIFVIRVSNSYPADFLHQLVFGLKLIAVKLIHDETLVDLLRFLSCQTRHSPKN